jgi:chromosome segregation ATPase
VKTLNSEQLAIVISLLDKQICKFKQTLADQEQTYKDCKSKLELCQYENDSTKLNITYSQEQIQVLKDNVDSSFEFQETLRDELNKYEALRLEL